MTGHEVVVVGAGLSGLTCALTLEAEGVPVRVLEASDGVGGRVRTDVVDGFLLDRGFQVLNPAYSMLQTDLVDLDALDLQPFQNAVAVRSPRHEQLVVLADIRREPTLIPATFASGKLHPASIAALARWYAPSLLEGFVPRSEGDVTRAEALDRAGLTGPLRKVVDRFLAGVLQEDDGSTSNAFTLGIVRDFLRGTASLPSGGMQRLPEQLAGRLRRPVELDTPVESVRGGQVRTAGGETIDADLVVVATDALSAERLTGRPVPRGKGLTTHWFAADEAPSDKRKVTLDQVEREVAPVITTAVISNVAPSYAPPGRHLVQASSLLRPGAEPVTDADVRQHLGQIWGTDTSGWELLRRDDIPYALPVQPVPFVERWDLEVEPGLILAGDHVDTASIEGAMQSGRRAAEGWLQRQRSSGGPSTDVRPAAGG